MNDSAMRNACAMPAGFGLLAIFDGQAPRAAVAEQLPEARQILRRGNQAKLADAALDERRERIIHHRLVVNRLELFARHQRERIQPRPGAASEDDAFHPAKGRSWEANCQGR